MGGRVPGLISRSGTAVAGLLLLGLLLLALLVAAVVRERTAPSVEEVTYRLQAESLIHDFDLVYGPDDIERFRAHGWAEDSLVALGLRPPERDVFQRPLPYPLLLAPFVALAPERGPAILNTLLLILAAVLTVRFLDRLVGDGAPWVTVALIFGSALFGSVFLAQPDILLVVSTVAVLTLAEGLPAGGRHPVGDGDLPDLHPGGKAIRPSVLRWIGIGLLLGIVVLHHPLYLLLAVLVGVRLPPNERVAALLLVALGLVVVLLIGWWAGGLYAELGPAEKLARADDTLAGLHSRGASPFTGAGRRVTWPPRLEPALLGWNALYLLAGRHVGLLPYALPLVLLLALGSGSGRLRSPLLVAALVTMAFLVFFPFNFFGGPAVGNRWFLPLYAALWTVPGRPSGPAGPLLCLAIGGALLAPLWIGANPAEAGPGAAVLSRLPFETTQREIPVRAEVVSSDLRVRSTSASVAPTGGERPLALAAGGGAELVLVSPAGLESVFLDFGRAAKGEPALAGGSLGRTMFRPDGGVSYEVLLEARERRHSTWWNSEAQSVRVLRFEMPESERAEFGVSIP